ncbi:50S ribosomal protein L15 [Rubrobacter aplysinae]|uniref:50S ribosomal protein L15 n=1 Tax=Rubrobacter aplysinae TaxID=909625 RepID=UPI00064B8F01|nr:50S ribosomal protein L15 [Rubrobacter aplysinae]
MRLDDLTPAPGSTTSRKRLGRGKGSGHGKNAGRGHKGAGSRSGATKNSAFEGGQMPLQRRLPRLRGEARGQHTPAKPKVYNPVNVGELAEVSGDTIGIEELKAAGLVGKRDERVKILGDGEVGKAVAVRVHAVSGTAREKIESAGGSVEILEQ